MKLSLLIPALLLSIGCTNTAPGPGEAPELPPHLANPPSDYAGWMRASSQAESRLDWEAAGYCMDRAQEIDVDAPDAAFWNRRAGLADRLDDREAGITAREQLLALRPDDLIVRVDLADDLGATGRMAQSMRTLEHDYADAEDRRVAWEAAVIIQERAGEFGAAAVYARRIASDPGDRNPRVWWQRVSLLHERDGDLANATEAIQHALAGTDLRKEEEAALARLRAFETGEAQTIADGISLLRFHIEGDLRLAGLQYLAEQEFERDVYVFERALRDADARVVRGALEELSRRAEPGRVDAILPLLQHPEQEVQLAAISALGALATRAEIPLLIGLLDPEDRSQFRAARRAVEAATDHTIGTGLDPDLEKRRGLRQAWELWWSNDAGR